MTWFIVLLFALLGGLTQTVCGFGSVIVMLLAFPYFFTPTASTALASSISLGLGVMLAWRYRRYIRFKDCGIPTIIYTAVSVISVRLVPKMNLTGMGIALGAFFIILSLYYLFLAGKMSAKATPATMIVFNACAGACSGFFGIGGPLCALYFTAAICGMPDPENGVGSAPGGISEQKARYLASMQFSAAFCNILNLITRISNGIYTADLVPYSLAGIAVIFVSQLLGVRILGRINGAKLKKMIYVFVGISGCITLVKYLLK